MNSMTPYLAQLQLHQQQAATNGHRCVVVLEGTQEWAQSLIEAYQAQTQATKSVSLGWSEPVTNTRPLSFKQARSLLGSEIQHLYALIGSSFDANGFTAACGAIVAGGMLLVYVDKECTALSHAWLTEQLASFETLYQDLPVSPEPAIAPYSAEQSVFAPDLTQQQQLIPLVEKVAKGHRKRPLVVTADRGRGKSAGLGISLASLVAQHNLSVIVTAPAKASVETLFRFAADTLNHPFAYQLDHNNSQIRFVAPDELLRESPDADLVVVDEAAALPLPVLLGLVERYHRMVFSSTIHGYEGCGRGFTLKFMAWLDKHRPGWHQHQLKTPMRWNECDPLERWLNHTFVMDAEVEALAQTLDVTELSFEEVDKKDLLASHSLLRSVFGLLVNAHYQTTPNDLFTLLDDDSSRLYIARQSANHNPQNESSLVGVLLTVDEGGVDTELVEQVLLGKRRPAGHLVAANLANHMGISDALLDKSVRVMRIAVHPSHQRSGVGAWLLEQLKHSVRNQVSFISTSFGLSEELIPFWRSNQFVFAKVGVSRDQASGTYSSIWLCPVSQCTWIDQACLLGQQQLFSQLAYETPLFEASLAAQLVKPLPVSQLNDCDVLLLRAYAKGGNSLASVRSSALKALQSWALIELDIMHQQLLIDAIIKVTSTKQLCNRYHVTGAKALDQQLREIVGLWCDLQCKS